MCGSSAPTIGIDLLRLIRHTDRHNDRGVPVRGTEILLRQKTLRT